jgi:FG-GAP-like repeat/Gametolysin peptidase M11
MRALNRPSVARSFAVLLFAGIGASWLPSRALAHGDHEVVADQRATPVHASFEATVRTLLVEDEVTGTSNTYRLLATDDGMLHIARGDAAASLANGARYALSGIAQGRSLEIETARPLAAQATKAAPAPLPTTADGTLRLGHMDFADGHGEYFYAVFGVDSHQTILVGAEMIGELRNGMEVSAIGTLGEASRLDVERILIYRHAPIENKSAFTAKSAVTHTLAIVPTLFPTTPGNYPAEPFTAAALNTAVFAAAPAKSVVEYYKEVSYGQQLLTGFTANNSSNWVHAASVPPLDKNQNKQCDISFIASQGQAAALAAGYTSAQLAPSVITPGSSASANHVMYVFNSAGFNCGWLGLAYVGYGLAYSNQSASLGTIGHEFGHTFGLEHAGSVYCGSNPIGGTCSVTEYGDPFDVMGNINAMHFNAFQKNLLTWVPNAAVTTHAAGSATYVLAPIESPGGTLYGLRIPASANRTYWIEYRQPTGFDAAISANNADGAQIRVARPNETICSTCDPFSDDTEIVDMTPVATPNSFGDAALRTGSKFVDAYYGVEIEVLSRTATALTVKVTMLARSPAPDFDGTAKADLLWRNSGSGQTAIWLMKGLTSTAAATVFTDANWKAVRAADFDGDDDSDLLWQNDSTGQTAIWLMNGTSTKSSKVIFTDPDWRVEFTGDFDGDGKADLLWHNAATGETAIWLMNGTSSKSTAVIWPDSTWHVIATGDFNGDGKTDLVWRNDSNGQVAIWLMNGLTSIGAAVIFSDPTWVVTMTGDLDGDGKSDLIWVNSVTGRTAAWLMNGVSSSGSAYLTDDGTFQAKLVGDFDSDGKADILWYQPNGSTQVTLMNGLSAAAPVVINSTATLVPVTLGDFDGDGRADIVWQDTSTGKTSLWLMNGTTKSNSATLLAPAGWSVQPN